MSDALQTAIINWLRATADDAMGMEPGDRHMANETRKEIERLRDQVRRLQGEAPPLDKEQALKEMAQLSSYVDEVMAENERLQARVSELERQHEVKDEQFTTMQEAYQARVAELEQGLRMIAFDLFSEDAPPLAEKLLGETLEEYLAQYRETEE